MLTDPKISQITNYLRAEFSATKIYLFGSRAKGTARSDSDYDFVIVSSDQNVDKWQAFDKARREIFEKFDAKADAWVYTAAAFEELQKDFGSMPETAVNTGIEV